MWYKIIILFNKFIHALKQLGKIISNAQCISENENLKKDNEKLQNQLKIQKNAKFDGEFLWLEKERICLRCYDDSDRTNRCISRLIRTDAEEEEKFLCRVCKSHYSSIAAEKRFLNNLQLRQQKYCGY